ncbi:MAG: hypothetical protein HYT43_01070 [Candidatus Taylorbacteria bacterium]|nr:hypothetical protein [Candidatus Taylorbacteria bacterium]
MRRFIHKVLRSAVSHIILLAIFIAATVSAATTISTNIQTDGTLSVTGVGHFTDDINVYGGSINLGTGSASTTLTTLSETLLSLSDDLDIYGGELNLGSGSATTSLTSSGGRLGLASTSPWGFYSIESPGGATVGTANPIFVVGDQGTTSPFLFVSGNNGNVGLGSTSPTQVLSVTGTTTSSLGMRIGATGSGITQLRFGTCTYNPGVAINASTTVSTNCTGATGAQTFDRVFVTPVELEAGLVLVAASSTADDVIQVSVFNTGWRNGGALNGASVTPTSRSWFWMAIR